MSMKKRINLAKVPNVKPASDASQAKVGTKASADSMITGYGSAIDIPRTSLAKGGKFGETITPQALTFAVRREPVAKKLVMDVAEDIFDKWFTVQAIAKAEQAPDAGKTLDESTQTLLEKLNAKFILIRAAQYERRYGWSIIILGFKDMAGLETPVQNASEIDHLATYSPRAVTVEAEDESSESPRFGLPVMYNINRGKGKSFKVHYSRVLHVATRLDEHPWAGIPVLETVWDDMTVYRNMRWAAGQVYWRTAGLMVFTLPKDYTKEQIDTFFASLGDPNVRTFIGLPDDKKLEMLGVQGRVPSPEDYTSPILRSISMGSGIPKTKLEGTEAGAVTGSEVNQREYYKYVSDQQKLYESQTVGPLIDKLMEIGQLTPNVDYGITWASSFELDTTAQNAAKVADAQAAASELKYMLIDEVRAKRNLKTLSEVTGGKLDGQILLPPATPGAPPVARMSADEALQEPPGRSLLDFFRNLRRGDIRGPRDPA
jgi:hypothetical protein